MADKMSNDDRVCHAETLDVSISGTEEANTSLTTESQPHVASSIIVPTLQEMCWKVIKKDVCAENVLPILHFMQQVETLISPQAIAHCREYIAQTYNMMSTRASRDELAATLGEALLSKLEQAAAEREHLRKLLSVRGRIMESVVPGEDCKLQEPSVSGHPHSYRLSALVAGVSWPADVDVTRRQDYLSHEEFARVLGVTYEQWLQLPQWRKLNLQKKHQLF